MMLYQDKLPKNSIAILISNSSYYLRIYYVSATVLNFFMRILCNPLQYFHDQSHS